MIHVILAQGSMNEQWDRHPLAASTYPWFKHLVTSTAMGSGASKKSCRSEASTAEADVNVRVEEVPPLRRGVQKHLGKPSVTLLENRDDTVFCGASLVVVMVLFWSRFVKHVGRKRLKIRSTKRHKT